MTSEEIKNLKRGFGDAMDWTEAPEQFAHRAIDGIWEIAFQLAVMNERTTASEPAKASPVAYDGMAKRCECGHRLGRHLVFSRKCDEAGCECASFRDPA